MSHIPPIVRPFGSALLIIMALGLAAAQAAAAPAAQAAAGQPRSVPTTSDAPWLHEDDFDADKSLHATEFQPVVLELEGAAHGRGGLKTNRFRFLLEQSGDFSFCIPDHDPHLVRIKLKKHIGRTLLHSRRGDPCEPVALQQGSYELSVVHDSSTIPIEGKRAFFHLTNQPRFQGSELNADTAMLSFLPLRSRLTGYFVTSNSSGDVQAASEFVGLSSVWQLTPFPCSTTCGRLRDGNDKTINFMFQGSRGGQSCDNNLFLGDIRKSPQTGCDPLMVTFDFNGPARGSFNLLQLNAMLAPDVGFYNAGILVDLSNSLSLISGPPNSEGDPFSSDYRGFTCDDGDCGSSNLALQQGEVALFQECNFQGAAIVFTENIPNLGIYNVAGAAGLGMGSDMARSVRVGPNTLAILHSESQFGGASFGTIEDIPCLDATSVGNAQTSSLQILNPRQYVIDTNGCVDCDLTGIDLSNLNLAGAVFSRSNLTMANLTSTNLEFARLDGTNLAMAEVEGVDFSGGFLNCTDLSSTDLTAATFSATELPVVVDADRQELISFDPVTGTRALLSGTGAGAGPAFNQPRAIAREETGLLVVTDVDLKSLVRVNPATGNRSIVSGPDRGAGKTFRAPFSVAVAPDGTLLVSDFFLQTIFVTDPITGDRTVLSSASVGAGPQFITPFAVVAAADGTVLVADNGFPGLFMVDPVSGDRTLISGVGIGSGPSLPGPFNLAVDGAYSVLVVDSVLEAVLRVDLGTGDRMIVSGAGIGSGPAIANPGGLTLDSDGAILLAVDHAVIKIDPTTGERTIVTGSGVGSGSELSAPYGVSIAGAQIAVTTDRSCRLNLARATLDFTTFPLDLWRYFDLTGATVHGTAGQTFSTLANPLDLSGALLSGVDLSGGILKGVNLGCYASTPNQTSPCPAAVGAPECAVLQATNLSETRLDQACLADAQMQGASLTFANLDFADLSGAKLLGLQGGSPANLTGAFMRNVSLVNADLTGVTADSVSFYTISDLVNGSSADASNATLTGAKFNHAYLAGANFGGSNSILTGTSWNSAVLVGANFTDAHLEKNNTADEVTDFTGAYLHGAIFNNATLTDVVFTNSYWDLDPPSSGTTLNIQMQTANLGFAGYRFDPSQPECVQAAYPTANFPSATPPASDTSNICPDGSQGPCDKVWEQPRTAINSQAPLSAVDPALPVNPGHQCTTTDSCWLSNSTFCTQ